MNKVVSFAKSLGIGAIIAWILTSLANADDSLVFDFRSPRKLFGLGVQLWPDSNHQTERDALLHDLHVKYVRVGFAVKVDDQRLKNHMSIAQISAAIAKGADEEQTTVYSRLHDEIRQLHLGLEFVFWQVPSAWCVNTGDGEISHARINPDHIQDYANWIVAHLLYAKRLRLLPNMIEMINEPDSSSGTQFTPEQYDALLFAVRATLDRSRLPSVSIEGPGVGSAATLQAYTQVLERTGHISLLNQLSWHDSDTARRPEPAGFAGVPAGVLANAHQMPIAITVFNSQSPQWDRLPYETGPRTRGPNNASDSPDFGVSVVAEAIKLIADGASSLCYWQAEDPAWTEDAFGLLNMDGQRKPAAAALRMFCELIPVNADIAGSKQVTSFGLASICFRSDHGLVLAAANLNQDSRKLDVQILNAPSPSKLAVGRRFDSRAPTAQPIPSSEVTIDGQNISLVLPPRSITVLRMQ